MGEKGSGRGKKLGKRGKMPGMEENCMGLGKTGEKVAGKGEKVGKMSQKGDRL